MNRRTLYLACGIPAVLLLFLLLTLLFTPNHAIKGVLVRAAENEGYVLECAGFGKSFPLGLKSDKVELSSAKGSLLKLDHVQVRLQILPLFIGKARVAYRFNVGAGEAKGELDLGKSKGWSMQCRGVRLEDIPFFTTVAEAKVKGELKLSGRMEASKGGAAGELQIEVRAAEVGRAKIGAMPLPDAAYREVRGVLKIEKGRAVLKSFTLNGDGIYVRLSGDTVLGAPVGASPLNITMEMMPKPSFLERQKFVFLLLTKYQSSPGAFSIPIRGTLAHPSI